MSSYSIEIKEQYFTSDIITVPFALCMKEFLYCDGSEVPSEQFNALGLLITGVFGSTSNPRTFKLPDFQGRIAKGASAQGGDSDYRHGRSVDPITELRNENMPVHTHQAAALFGLQNADMSQTDYADALGNTTQNFKGGTPIYLSSDEITSRTAFFDADPRMIECREVVIDSDLERTSALKRTMPTFNQSYLICTGGTFPGGDQIANL